MWRSTLRKFQAILLNGLILSVVLQMATEAKAVPEQSHARPWDSLPLPKLGMWISNNTPVDRPRTHVWIQMPQIEIPKQATGYPISGYSNVFDLECYEGPRDLKFLGHRTLKNDVMELRHRSGKQPHLILVTELTPQPGKVQIVARIELDSTRGNDKQIPQDMLTLNMCPSLIRARGSFVLFAAYPYPFPEVIDRCFIFTDKGRTFLKDTVRFPLPCIANQRDDPRNSPPWIQGYTPVWRPTRKPTKPGSLGWYTGSTSRFTIPILGVVSLDGKHLIALANDSSNSLVQAWGPCLHNNPHWLPKDAPPAQRRWRVNVYIMPNDPDMLLERVAEDLPDAIKLQANRVLATPFPGRTPRKPRPQWR